LWKIGDGPNRHLNAAIHRIAITQARCHPDARTSNGVQPRATPPPKPRRALKRAAPVWRALLADADQPIRLHSPTAA